MATIEKEFARLSRREEHGDHRWEEIVALLGGGTLAITGLMRRSAAGTALAAAGGFLIFRGATSEQPLTGLVPGRNASPVHAQVAVTINKPVEEVYAFFRNFENLPRFMQHLESVSTTGSRSHWVACGPLGRHIEWDAEIADERENEVIAWRSTGEATVPNWGRVRFRPAPAGRGTEVHVELEYLPPAGEVGRIFAKLMGEEPEIQVYEDMHRLKQLLEAGEIATTEGQPSGRRSALARAASRWHPAMAQDREIQRVG